MQQAEPEIKAIHVYLEFKDEDDDFLEGETIDADQEYTPSREQTRYPALGALCLAFLVLLCVGSIVWNVQTAPFFENAYDTTINKTLTLVLSQQPTSGQVPLYTLPAIQKSEQLLVTATGSIHQQATRATGLLTFFNGSFSAQTVPAGTKLVGKDGIAVVTEQDARIPEATPTIPPTDGTVSVTASSEVAGSAGNIAACDINETYTESLFVRNLYAFSGGQDARRVPVLQQPDLETGRQTLTGQVHDAVDSQAQADLKPGYVLFPLDCVPAITTSHQADEQVASATITVREVCTPLVYLPADVESAVEQAITLPHGYHRVSDTTLVLSGSATQAGGKLVVHAVVSLKRENVTGRNYRFANK